MSNKSREKVMKIGKKKILIVLVIVFVVLFLYLTARYKYYHPAIIKEGNNHYEIGTFGISNLEKDGLDEFIDIMSKTNKVNHLNSNIVNLNIVLKKNGNIKKLEMTVNYFDDNYNYVGNGYYKYEKKNLEFKYENKDDCKTVNECEVNKMLVTEYSKSLNIRYLSNNIKRIPFKQQIKLSNLKFYKISMEYNQKFSDSTNVFDMRDNKEIEALSLSDYKSGKGGNILPGIYLVITLSDGSSVVADEIYRYILDTVEGDVKKVDYTMQTDYYINGKNQLLFTRDYGNNWIETDLTSDEVKETLNFYRDISLQNSSWFISINELIPIAYFYGKQPKLKISNDNGFTWNEKTFDIAGNGEYKDITKRVIGFNNQNFGYAALGTDWSMGTGEFKNAYLTNDGGKTWSIMELPENGTSKTLIDFIMYDENNGIVLLSNNQEYEFPYMYITKDRGKNWKNVEYVSKIPKDVFYISNIDLIEKNHDQYIITLSQGDSATTKVKLKSSDLINWIYDSTFTSNIHTVG